MGSVRLSFVLFLSSWCVLLPPLSNFYRSKNLDDRLRHVKVVIFSSFLFSLPFSKFYMFLCILGEGEGKEGSSVSYTFFLRISIMMLCRAEIGTC